MSQQPAPRINKLPFLLTDLVFIGVALGIIYRSQLPLGGSQILAVVVCVALGAWACLTPFLRDHDAAVRRAESDYLADTVRQIQHLREVGSVVQSASAQWQIFQENSAETSAAMQRMANQLTNDARNFAETLKQANDVEKTALRLEVDKRQRAEGEWLKILVGMLDHVHALHQAAVRSGQENVIRQLTGFQTACRDLGRRVGLAAVEVQPGDAFNPTVHRTQDENQTVPEGAVIAGMLATGFTFQGQLVRPVLVAVESAMDSSPAVADSGNSGSIDEPASLEAADSDTDWDADEPDDRRPVV
jgi:molecular chaperone GrpE (heat shock protein)